MFNSAFKALKQALGKNGIVRTAVVLSYISSQFKLTLESL